MEKSIFEIGKTYSIHTKGGQRYDDATVNAVDNILLQFVRGVNKIMWYNNTSKKAIMYALLRNTLFSTLSSFLFSSSTGANNSIIIKLIKTRISYKTMLNVVYFATKRIQVIIITE